MAYFGIDVHSRTSDLCEVSSSGEVVRRVRISTTSLSFERFFAGVESRGVVLEAGTESPWLARLLESLGHEVTIVDARRVRLIAESSLKTDVSDAEILARLLRADPVLLRRVHARSEPAQLLGGKMRVRSSLVRARTSQINTLRGILRSHGQRMQASTPAVVIRRYGELELGEALRQILDPVIDVIAHLSETLRTLDAQLKAEAREDEIRVRLQSVPGIGPVISSAFVAWVDDPHRFRRSRDVGACLGLRPALRSSGGRERRGRITREGDRELRRLLVQGAHVLVIRGPDCALRRWALALSQRSGRKKAVVALARKLAVLLHRLWVTQEPFRAFPQPA